MSIFIQIAAYRDPQLLPTLRDCIKNADKPEDLVFSITWQHSTEDEWDNLDEFKNDPRFKVIDVDYRDSKGCCWARNLLQQQYNGEDYTLQLDSHHRFVQGWDTKCLEMYNQLKAKGIKKPLLTAYLPSFQTDKDPGGRVQVPWKMNFDRFIPEGAVFFSPASIDNFESLTEPIPARFYSAHFCFTSGDFVKEVQHDPNYYFHGEEISVGVRAFTHGYDLFHPHRIIAWHEYTRVGRPKVWDNDTHWTEKNDASHLRNRKLFEMDGLKRDIDFGIYDFGKERTLEDYERYAGVNFKKRSVQGYTLQNKIAPNPPLYGEEYEKSWVRRFKHIIDLKRSNLPPVDYDFIAVIFKAEGKEVHRSDLKPEEIKTLLKGDSEYIYVRREFDTWAQPDEWIVWLHYNGEWKEQFQEFI